MKQNDWIVANINNSEFTPSDFKNILGLSLENTQLLPEEFYVKSKFITNNNLFKDSSGNFDKNKFSEFYKNLAAKFANFQEESSLDNYEFGFWDIYLKPDSRVKNPNFNLDTTINPDHVSTGVIGPNMVGERTKTAMELAEKLNIFDWDTQLFKNESAEDSALFSNPIKFIKNLFSDPLVLATYDEDVDEIDKTTGEIIHHYKGDRKLNDKGEYYLETLGGRSVVGKDVLSVGDILTKEDSIINKMDFIDSDDLDKSPTGVIAKNLAAIAPMVFLGPVGAGIYSGFYVARELLKSTPMMYKFLTMFSDSEDPKLINTLAGIGQKFTGGTSEYAKEHTFSLENFGNLIADVALQWGLQKLIAESVGKLSGGGKGILEAAESKAALEYEKRATEIWNRADNGIFDKLAAARYTGIKGIDGIKGAIETGNWRATSVGNAAMLKFIPEAEKAFSKRALLGLDLSLVYMSLISNSDVYSDALEHGATKMEAAAVALGSTIGMFSVDKYAHLGEIFFDETPEKMALRNLRLGIREEASAITLRIGTSSERETRKGLLGLMQKGVNSAKNFIKDYESGLKNHTLGFFGKAFGEGLEEVSEELVTDISKSLYELAGKFGYVSQTDIGAWDNMPERYAMSLFGGAIGGGLFYGVDAIRNPKSKTDQNLQKELLYLVSQGKTLDILDNLEDMKKNGKLGSTSLSTETIQDSNGNKVFLTADSEHESQNDFVHRVMKNSILQMESIINEHGLNLTDDQLFEKMVLSNQRYIALKNSLFDKSYITQYYDDFQQIVQNIYNIEKNIQDLKDNTTDKEKRSDESDYQEKLEQLEKLKLELILKKNDFLEGKYNLEYVDKMLFYIHPEINNYFYSSTYELWVNEKYHKDVNELSEGEAKKYQEEYELLKKSLGKELLNTAYNLYKTVRTDIESGLGEVSNDDVMSWGRILKQLQDTAPETFGLKYDDRIPKSQLNLTEYLNSLNIVKTSEYLKPWRDDPSKSNTAFLLLLSEDSTQAFEIVKDHEDGYWSIHFKTDRTNLTNEQKQRLFRAAAAVIPEGDKLSTWGHITKGGISGLNRFGQLDFIGGFGFNLVGTRSAKLRNNLAPRPANPKYISIDNLGDLDFDKYYYFAHLTLTSNAESILNNGLNTRSPGLRGTALQISSKEDLDSYIESMKNGTLRHKGSEGFALIRVEKGKITGNDPIEDIADLMSNPTIIEPDYVQNYVEVIPTTTADPEKDVEIPIWQKEITGESDEDYNDRNTQRAGESDEDFKARLKARRNRIEQYNKDHYIDYIEKFLDNNSMIDRSSYRKLMALLGIRQLDVLHNLLAKSKMSFVGMISASARKEFSNIVMDSLKKLKSDLSNKDEVIDEIITKTKLLRKREWDSQNKHRKIVLDTKDNTASIVRNMETIGDTSMILPDKITFDDFIDAVNLSLEDSPVKTIRFTETGDDTTSIYIEDFIDDYFHWSNNENSPLFNSILEAAIKVHNLQIEESSTGESKTFEIDEIKESIKGYYREMDASGNIDKTNILFFEGEVAYDDVRNELLDIEENLLKKELNNVINDIEKDKDLKVLNDLRKKVSLDLNPVIKVLKAVLPKLGEDFGDIEETLESIYLQFDSLDIPTNFTLTSTLKKALEKALQYLDFVRAVVMAAKTNSSYFAPLPYNKSINSFIKDSKDIIGDVKELLELDDDLANVIEESANHFNNEIRQWISRGEKGVVNKREMFSKFDEKFTKAKLDFFMQIKDQCKVKDKDLLKGIEHIDVDKPDALVEIEKLFYNNFIEAGLNATDLVSLIEKQTVTKNILKQDTGLNKSLDSDFVFTDYDKFIYLISLVASDPVDFYNFYKDYVTNSKGKNGLKIAPLTFQEWNIRLGYIHKQNPTFINEVIQEFANKFGIKIPIIKNAVFINGIAGVGKTDVVIRALQDSDSVWVSGPSSTLIDNLKEIIPHADALGRKELFTRILGESVYNEIMSEVKAASTKKEETRKNAYKGKYITSEANKEYALLKDGAITFITKDAPKQLVIDEVTLFSNIELQLLSKWAEKTRTLLILAGDTHLNGDNSIGFNLDPETSFTFRTPEMKISLRDANIWKFNNLKNILLVIDEINNYHKPDLVKSQLNNFNFSYYLNNDKLTGEIVTSNLEDSHIKSLNGSIAFIGDTSSEAYKKLKNSGKTIEVFDSVDKIQGKEFDYVVADIDLSYSEDGKFTPEQTLKTWLNNLYTIITRSKNGTILIDNGLTSTVSGSTLENYSTNNIGISPDITTQYVEDKLKFLTSLDLTRKVPLAPIDEEIKEDSIVKPEEEPALPSDPEEEPETEDDSYLDEEAILETITPVFGNINLSGLIMSSDGKLSKSGNRDLGIFLNDGDKIDSKDRPLQDLFLLKSLILFDKIGDDYWWDKTSPQIKSLFSLEDLKNIKYYVSAEDYDPNIHKLLTKEAGYSDDKLAFEVDGIKKVFTLIGVIEKGEKSYEITLGGLSNPDTLLANKDRTVELIRLRANKVSDSVLKDKLLDHADNYESRVEYYRNKLKELVVKGRWQIKKPYLDRCTRIQRIKDSDGKVIYHPLNEYFDLNTSLYVVSPVYTQIDLNGEETKFPYLQDDAKGKPFIFVSAFNLLSPTELADIYAKQKANPNDNYPEVRKIFLRPRGVFFEDLVNLRIVGAENSDELVFPFSNTAVAFRMYMSLWNFRATINLFNSKVEEYLQANNLSADELNLIAIEEAAAYNGKDTFREDVTDELKARFEPLWKLNDWLTELDVPRFRLGYNAANGMYSRNIKNGISGTFINYQMALDYLKVINTLFTNVIDKLIPVHPSMNTINTLLGKTSDFEKKKALETWVRKLASGQSINLELRTDDTHKTIPFLIENIEAFRYLPLALVQISKNLNFAQSLAGGITEFKDRLLSDPTTLSWLFISTTDVSGNKTNLDYISIADQLSGGLQTTSTSGASVTMPGVVPYSETGGNYDRRIINFFNLAFHGNVAREAAPAEDAMFKYGIFVDTFLLGNYDENSAFRTVSTNRGLYDINAMPSSPVAKIDITPWDGTIEETSGTEEATSEDPELLRINAILGKSWDELDPEKVKRAVDRNKQNLFENSLDSDAVLDTFVEVSDTGYNFKNVRQIIQEQIGAVPNSLNADSDGSSTKYEFKIEEDEYEMYLENNDIIIKAKNKTLSTLDYLLKAIQLILSYQSVIEDSEFLDEVENAQGLLDGISQEGLNKYDYQDNIRALLSALEDFDNEDLEDFKSDLSTLQNLLNKISC